LVLSSESRACSRRIVDICEEKLGFWADLELIVMLRVAIKGGDEYLNHVFLIQRIVAVLICRNDFGISSLPFDVQELCVVAH
jgi:hypothetical protein